MSFDIDKQPLTLLSNEASNIQENEYGYSVEIPLVIDDRNWNTVSQYVYTNLLQPKYEKEYNSAIRKKGYVIAFNDINKQALLSVVSDALMKAYEKLIFSNDHLANILVKTGNTMLAFDGAFLDAMFQRDAASVVGDVLMNIRKNIVKRTIDLKTREKTHQLVPLLHKIYTAFLWLKCEVIENKRDIKQYEGKTLDEIIASAAASENFKHPKFELCRQVYRRISIPVEIIENIKNSPKKFSLYENYLQTVLQDEIFDRVKNFILYPEEASTSLEEILCHPIPIEIIKVFSSDVNKLVPQVRKMFLRKAYEETLGWQKDQNKMIKVVEHFADELFPARENSEKKRIVDKLIEQYGTELFPMIAKTKNKKVLDQMVELEKQMAIAFSIADVEQAEKFSLNAALIVEPLNDDQILSKILEDARIDSGLAVDKSEKSPFSEQTTIAYNSDFSPFMTSLDTQLIFDDLQFPTIAHYVIFKLVSAFPNIKLSELITFYNNVILCGDKNVPEKKFIAFDRLMEIYIQLYQSIAISTKKFYLENALTEKFLGSQNTASEEVAKHEVFVSSNKADEEMSQMTVDWLNQNKNKINMQLQQVDVEHLDFKSVEKYKNIFTWVTENISDFIFSAHLLFLYCEKEINEKRDDVDTLDCVETFATTVYFKNKSEIALAKTDLASIVAPGAIRQLFRGKFKHLLPAADYIYRIIIAPLYFTSNGMNQSVMEIEKKIKSAQRSLSNPAIQCSPLKLRNNEEQLALFREKIDNDNKCLLTAIITVLLRMVDFSRAYEAPIKIGYDEVTLAASIIYNYEFQPIRENNEIPLELHKYLQKLVSICFPSAVIQEETVIAIFSCMQKVADLLYTQTIKQNRTLHFVDDIST